MSQQFKQLSAKLIEALSNPLFPELDTQLRAGRHICTEDLDKHAFIHEYYPELDSFYRRYAVELIHAPEDFYYLRTKSTSVMSSSQLSEMEMLAGKILCLLYLSPERLAQQGIFSVQEVYDELVSLVSVERLVKIINPRSTGSDLDKQKLFDKLKSALNRLDRLGMISYLKTSQDRSKFVVRAACFRFGAEVRTGENPLVVQERLIRDGEIVTPESLEAREQALGNQAQDLGRPEEEAELEQDADQTVASTAEQDEQAKQTSAPERDSSVSTRATITTSAEAGNTSELAEEEVEVDSEVEAESTADAEFVEDEVEAEDLADADADADYRDLGSSELDYLEELEVDYLEEDEYSDSDLVDEEEFEDEDEFEELEDEFEEEELEELEELDDEDLEQKFAKIEEDLEQEFAKIKEELEADKLDDYEDEYEEVEELEEVDESDLDNLNSDEYEIIEVYEDELEEGDEIIEEYIEEEEYLDEDVEYLDEDDEDLDDEEFFYEETSLLDFDARDDAEDQLSPASLLLDDEDLELEDEETLASSSSSNAGSGSSAKKSPRSSQTKKSSPKSK